MRKWIFVAMLFAVILTGCSKTREEQEEIQKGQIPVLICTKEGVKVWRVWDETRKENVYFTTPTGDVQWSVPGGEDAPPVRKTVPGSGKPPVKKDVPEAKK
jgi:hypothetical protein